MHKPRVTHNPVIINRLALFHLGQSIHLALERGDLQAALELDAEYNAVLQTIRYYASIN